jgi:hypothetical protein
MAITSLNAIQPIYLWIVKKSMTKTTKDVMVMERDPVTGAQPLLTQVFLFT